MVSAPSFCLVSLVRQYAMYSDGISGPVPTGHGMGELGMGSGQQSGCLVQSVLLGEDGFRFAFEVPSDKAASSKEVTNSFFMSTDYHRPESL